MKIKKYKINLIFLIFSILLISSFLFFEIIFVSNNIEKTTLKNAVGKSEERSRVICDFIHDSNNALLALDKSESFKNYLQTENKNPVIDLFKSFVYAHKSYMQLRYIDKSGYEKIRIDREKTGLVKVLTKSELQDRSNRDYFIEAQNREPNKVYFSTITSLKPTIRAILPLKQDGNFNGILILNYDMEEFLNKLFSTNLYDMILINNRGEILKHHETDTRTILNEFGADTAKILSKDLFIGKHFVSRKVDTNIEDGLILIFELNHEYAEALYEQQVQEYITIAILVFVLSLVANIFIANSVKKINRDLTKSKALNVKLQEMHERLNDAQKIANIGFWELNALTDTIYWSGHIFQIFELSDTNITPSYEMFLSYVHPDDREKLNDEYQSSIEQKRDYYIAHKIITTSGDLKFVEEHAKHYYDDNGKHIKSLGSMYDKTQEMRSQNTLNHYLKLIDENIITSSTDLEGIITEASAAFCKISEYSKDELIGHSHRIIKHEDNDSQIFKQMWQALNNNSVWEGEIKNKTKSGGYYWIEATIYPDFDCNGNKTGYTSIRHDITDKKLLEAISITDATTGLYNRRHFNDIFPKAVNSAKRKHELLSLMIIDIDHFKQYNDTYGHQMGDYALTYVAHAISHCLNRSDDYAFRLGGEEFGVIYRPESKEKALRFAQKIRKSVEALEIEHTGNSASAFITISIGLITKDIQDIDSDNSLYKEADDYLYLAKESGRNQVCSNLPTP